MARYVDVDELKKRAYPFPCAIGVEYAVSIRQIDEAPTADVVEVKHGEWIDGYCSECGVEALSSSYEEQVWGYDWEENLIQLPSKIHIEYHTTDYCPNCGAKMDLKEGAE